MSALIVFIFDGCVFIVCCNLFVGMAKPLYYDVLKMRDIDAELTRYLHSEQFALNPHHWCLGKEIWGRSLLIFHRSSSEVLLGIGSTGRENKTVNDAASSSSTVVNSGVSAAAASSATETEHKPRTESDMTNINAVLNETIDSRQCNLRADSMVSLDGESEQATKKSKTEV